MFDLLLTTVRILSHHQEARIPLLLGDAVLLFGLSYWNKKAKEAEDKGAKEDEVVHEAEKKATRAQKAADREQRKFNEKKTQHVGGPVNFGLKNPIQQPDRNKKQR